MIEVVGSSELVSSVVCSVESCGGVRTTGGPIAGPPEPPSPRRFVFFNVLASVVGGCVSQPDLNIPFKAPISLSLLQSNEFRDSETISCIGL